MNRDAVFAHALGKPGAWHDSPWGPDHDVAKVGDKIFVFLWGSDGPPVITVKNTAEAIEELKQRWPSHVGPAPYLNKRLWAQVSLDGFDPDEALELIDDSYDLVVASLPKSKRPAP